MIQPLDSSQEAYHLPVLLEPALDGLTIRPEGRYVDCTFGGGGHSRGILERLGPKGRLFAFDQDNDARANLPDDSRITFLPHNFRHLGRFLRLHNAIPVDGILADLGVSSHQFDEAERGFSYRYDAELDMRMNRASGLTAKEVIGTYTEADLHRIFGIYGEIQNAKSLANTIVTSRLSAPINTVADLKNAISARIPKGKENKYLAQVFQALRIEGNQELEALKDFLIQSAEVLVSGGRLVVMSYHS